MFTIYGIQLKMYVIEFSDSYTPFHDILTTISYHNLFLTEEWTRCLRTYFITYTLNLLNKM